MDSSQYPHSNYTYYPHHHLPNQTPNPPLKYLHLHQQQQIPTPPGVVDFYARTPNAYNSVDLSYPHHQSTQVGILHGPSPSYYKDATFTQISQLYGNAPHPPTFTYSSNVIDPSHNNLDYLAIVNDQSSHPSGNGDMPTSASKPKVSQAMRCEVCNVDCNSKDSLVTHMQGKKHKNALLLQQQESLPTYTSMPQGIVGSSPVSTAGNFRCSTCNIVCNSQVLFEAHLVGKKHASQVGIPKKSTIAQSAWCEICKIDCTSGDTLKSHRMGKKHQKNLQKLLTNNTQIPVNPVIGPQENSSNSNEKHAKRKTTSAEDVETKRQKVVSAGAAADAVRVCQICNVVCNSQLVFNTHLVGQKHISMVKKKHAEANGRVFAVA